VGESSSLHGLSFNRAVKIESRLEHLSSDAGSLLLREAMERTGVIADLTARLHDPRDQTRIEHSLDELLRTMLITQAQGWEDQRDVDALRYDSALLIARSDRRGQGAATRTLGSQSTFSRLLDLLSQENNRAAMEFAPLRLAGMRLRCSRRGRRPRTLTLDVDGLPLPVHGEQPGSAYNGYVRARMHYPLIASCAETGDMLAGLLRAGNAGAAAQAKEWIPRLVEQAERDLCCKARVRLDAGFTDGATLEALDQHGIGYIGRLRENPAVQRLFNPYRKRGPGRPHTRPREWLEETTYQAASWTRARRLLIVIKEDPSQLFRECFYLITNLKDSPEKLLALYRRRGKAEGHMGEFKDVIGDSLPSTSRGQATEETVLARSQALLSVRLLAYQVMHVLRALIERRTGQGWSLRRLRERVLKVAARVQRSGRRLIVVIAYSSAEYWDQLLLALGRLHDSSA
jgi:hypothetical protein